MAGAIAAVGAAIALPVASRLALPASHLFLYDVAFDPDGRLLRDARRLGLRPRSATDLGAIAHALDAGSHNRLAGIAGVTAPAVFFVVEQIAVRRGLRLCERQGAWWAFGPHGSDAEAGWS